ncbi:peptidoglycan-binding protein [Cyanosarcina cf. burmensis CCALA 770]|nr:peptidoglycan-binding protein [Cyanosarcina cf. burmensis CCALA 770]
MSKVLTSIDYTRCATLLGVDPASVRAVVAVECSGSGFLADGRPKILFERHWFYKLTPLPVSKTRPDISNRQPGGYLGSTREWDRLNAAISFDRTAALKSASWGLGQIMGFNYAFCGFDSVEALVGAMHESEGRQLEAMMRFIKANPSMHQALRDRNWQRFAYYYNGPAYRRNDYDNKLAAAFSRFQV